MKKNLIALFVLVCSALSVWAGYMPFYSNAIPNDALGLYQPTGDVKVLESPSETAKEKCLLRLDYTDMQEGVFAAFVPEKELVK